jgi:2-polyprenyl-3-methyl-5-hydroxy-6-metoxy-1,4-benzoquinol methylase
VSTDPAGRAALSAYAGAPRGDRLHVRIRWHSCPFPELERHVPPHGRILDVGCGHGLFPLYLGLAAAGREVTGTDVDADKLTVARAAATSIAATARFEPTTPGVVPTGPWDAITVVDVLYLLGHDAALDLVRTAADALAPGGTLLVKEISLTPRWKHAVATAQELLATRVLRITEGTDVAFLPPHDIAAAMEGAGLQVEQRPLHRGRLHPHHLLVGRSSAGHTAT